MAKKGTNELLSIVQMIFEVGCEQGKTRTKHDMQDVTEILCNVMLRLCIV